MSERAIWLRREGDSVLVLVEDGARWVEVIREHFDGPFSHIVEPPGIESRINGTPMAVDPRSATKG